MVETANKGLAGLGVGEIATGILSKALCLVLESLEESVVEALHKPQEWVESVKEGIESALKPIDGIREVFDRVVMGAQEAITGFTNA